MLYREITIEIEEESNEESILMPNGKKEPSITNPSNSPALGRSITPKTPNNLKQRFGGVESQLLRNDTEGLIMSTRSITLAAASPFKKTPKASQEHKTITSLSKQKEKFTRLDTYNELEINFGEYFSLKDDQ